VTVDRYKPGTFALSSLGFALYSTGHKTSTPSNHPFGLIYEDGEAIMSLGYFIREQTEEGHLVITAPTGNTAIEKADELTRRVMVQFGCGTYARFLGVKDYTSLLFREWLPPKEHPWHPEAPEEDETYCNSEIYLPALLSIKNGIDVQFHAGKSRKERRKPRDTYNRFCNFLERTGATYHLEKYTAEKETQARDIIRKHFTMLEGLEKRIGSSAEDYGGLLNHELIESAGAYTFIGYLNDAPVSFFAGEPISDGTIALYAAITRRDGTVLSEIGITDEKGFTALPHYAYMTVFAELMKNGFTNVQLGGSELQDLNKFKRSIGAQPKPTYWAVKLP
jgi:hypothetical protein